MRYKVKAPSLESYLAAEKIARADTHVFVALAGRRILSVGNLSEAARQQLIKVGASVSPDGQYSLTTS